MPGTLFVVATPIGNLEDITVRALRILREVALIAAEDTRRTAHLLARYAISTPATSLHEHNEATKTRSILARLQQGQNVALVSDAGTPTISDPGQRLIRSAIDAGLRIEAVPGPSATLAALAASGIPGDTFTFLGFPPTKSTDRKQWLSDLSSAGRTVVFFEAPHRIRATLNQIRDMAGDLPVVIARELTKAHEELVRGPISVVLDRLNSPRGELTVVVDLGLLTNYWRRGTTEVDTQPVGDAVLLIEFGQMTTTGRLTRRRAISLVARRHHLSANQVYDAIERAKKLAE
jgi:16S rRNA (cytidine1402-2'-O)-methyltransferase